MEKRNYTNQFSCLFVLICVFVLFSGYTPPAYAEDYTSANFILRDPVIASGGGRSTSPRFEYFSSTGQTATGENTGTTFISRAGVLYFPIASTPVVSATVGNGQVSLSWTAAVGTLGNVTEYRVGTATVAGGPYTFASVGNVLTSTRTGLTNGTPYFFRVQALAGGDIAALSAEVSSTPAAPAAPSGSGGGGGGGGGGYVAPVTSVDFSGRAYPKSTVTLLKDAQIAATTIAGTDANFKMSISGLSAGNFIFSLYSEDKDGRRSALSTFPVSITSGTITNVSGIFIAPTIAVDKSEVKRGENIGIFGQSVPQSDIVVAVSSEEFFGKTIADKDGIYLYDLDTAFLELGSHLAKSKASIGNQMVSGYSPSVGFKVGTKTVVAEPAKKCPAKADLNQDCKVNLIDFSIVAFWYKRPLSAAFGIIEKERLNGDGKVNLTDFSVMAYYWTG